MPLAVDASSPTRVTGIGTAGLNGTTATFDPPASTLVACCSGDGTSAWSFTMSNNGAALTWNSIGLRNNADTGGQSGVAQALWADLPAARTGMTVTYTYGTNNDSSMKLYVVTGVDAVTAIGGNTEGSSTTATTATTAYTSQVASSLGFVVFNDFNANTFTASSDTTMDTGTIAGQITYGSGYKSLGAAGSSVTHNLQLAGASTTNYVVFEIRPGAGGGGAAVPWPSPLNRVPINRASLW
jgi:hypothetical protein